MLSAGYLLTYIKTYKEISVVSGCGFLAFIHAQRASYKRHSFMGFGPNGSSNNVVARAGGIVESKQPTLQTLEETAYICNYNGCHP